jgi:hypothetical protein
MNTKHEYAEAVDNHLGPYFIYNKMLEIKDFDPVRMNRWYKSSKNEGTLDEEIEDSMQELNDYNDKEYSMDEAKEDFLYAAMLQVGKEKNLDSLFSEEDIEEAQKMYEREKSIRSVSHGGVKKRGSKTRKPRSRSRSRSRRGRAKTTSRSKSRSRSKAARSRSRSRKNLLKRVCKALSRSRSRSRRSRSQRRR